jgi:putative tryptophan/tyrosine transport system substrate-binding protein
MRRRDFIKSLGGAAASWPLAARAQQTGRVWRVAVIGAVSPLPAMLSAFREAVQQRGWTEGKNLSIDVRWPKGSFAQEPGGERNHERFNCDPLASSAHSRRQWSQQTQLI